VIGESFVPTFQTRSYQDDEDYWLIRQFLRKVFLTNQRRELSWNVARFDYWRWHIIENHLLSGSLEKNTALWLTQGGEMAGLVHPLSEGEVRIHIHPGFQTAELIHEMFAYAENHFYTQLPSGKQGVYTPVFADDGQRQEILAGRGYRKAAGISHHWFRDFDESIVEVPAPVGYTIRSMGTIDEHPARSLASWRAFHADEGEENYDQDWSWYQNVQSAPLYRRDLDIVAANQQGEICAFCTIYYDDTTRSAVCVLVGTAADHQQRGLGKAVMQEGFRRLIAMGCSRVFATAYDPPAEGLYGSMMDRYYVAETWVKELSLEKTPGSEIQSR
jgi:mycothiol synthase